MFSESLSKLNSETTKYNHSEQKMAKGKYEDLIL